MKAQTRKPGLRRAAWLTGALLTGIAVILVNAPIANPLQAQTTIFAGPASSTISTLEGTRVTARGKVDTHGKRVQVTVKLVGVPGSHNHRIRTKPDGTWNAVITIPEEAAGSGALKLRVTAKTSDGQTTETILVGHNKPLRTPRNIQLADGWQNTPQDITPDGNPKSHTYLLHDLDDQPLHWNPCEPVKWFINLGTQSPDMLTTTQNAFDELSRVTGIQFQYAGLTNFIPYADDAPSLEPGSITVAFTTSREYKKLDGAVAGLGGSRPERNGTGLSQGGVLIDADQAGIPGFNGRGAAGRYILHELGHVMNLGHVDDPTQLMNPIMLNDGPDTFQAGDLAGIHTLTLGSC